MAKTKTIGKINPFFEWVIVRFGLKLFFKLRFRLKANVPKEVAELKAPYVVLPNHQGFWDPFFTAIPLKDPLYYIASDAIFRSKLLSFALKFLGAIPKTKAQSDIDALKHIFEMKKAGRCIGIFAEGTRTYDGTTLPLIKSTAKLVRMLKIPVVTVVFKGGYCSQPRWGTSIRTGRLELDYKLLFTGAEVGSMKTSEIHEALTKAIAFDEIAWQQEAQIRFKSKKTAENIEQMLFACPTCNSMQGFMSKGMEFACKACHATWHIDEYLKITAVPPPSIRTHDSSITQDKISAPQTTTGSTSFENLRDWDKWQLKQLEDRIRSMGGSPTNITDDTTMAPVTNSADDTTEAPSTPSINSTESYQTAPPVIQDSEVSICTGYKSQQLKHLARGTLTITPDWVIHIFNGNNVIQHAAPAGNVTANCATTNKVATDNAPTNNGSIAPLLSIPIREMSGINVQNREVLDFYYQGTLYAFRDEEKHFNAHKWMFALNLIQREMLTLNLPD